MFILAFEIVVELVVLGKGGSGPTLNSITDVTILNRTYIADLVG